MTDAGDHPVDLEIEVMPELNLALPSNQVGQIVVRQIGDLGWQIRAGRRSDLSDAEVASFEEWARTTVAQLMTTSDPVSNGWYPSSSEPDVWSLTATIREMPDLS